MSSTAKPIIIIYYIFIMKSLPFLYQSLLRLYGKGPTVADYNSFKRAHIQADEKKRQRLLPSLAGRYPVETEISLKAYRFSLFWARILPDSGLVS